MSNMNESEYPVFSIITPTCRRPLLLQRTISSVISQTFKDYEHIIIDDANDEETEQFVKSLKDERIIFQQHITPKGAGGSYNTGIKISHGRFILFLDDDDEYVSTFLEKMYNHFSQSNLNLGFVWTGISRIRDTDTGEEVLKSQIWPLRFSTREEGLVKATSIGNGFGVCVKRECIDKIGLYDESLIFGQDTDFLFRLAENCEFETIPEPLVKIHQHSNLQLTDNKNNILRLEFRKKILNKHIDLLKLFPELYYVHYKVVVNLCYSLKLRQKGRETMYLIIKNTSFRMLNFIDLFFLELTGKDTITYYKGSKLQNLMHFLKKNILARSL
jgi:glycosyltransferase involved in cell wall biosynthesis